MRVHSGVLIPLLVFLGCSDRPTTSPLTGVPTIEVAETLLGSPDAETRVTLEAKLRRDPDAVALMEIRNELTRREVARSVTGAEARRLLANGDANRLAARLGYSPAEILAIDRRLRAARQSLLERYPEIRRLTTGKTCANPNPGPLSRYLDKAVRINTAALLPVPRMLSQEDPCAEAENPEECYQQLLEEMDEEGCEWLEYIACLSVCTLAGPYFYWPCAYLCLCGYGEGGLAEIICEGDT